MDIKNKAVLPSDFKLLTGEKLVAVETIDVGQPKSTPSMIKELLELDQVDSVKKLGETGPVLASLPLDYHEDDPKFGLFEAIFGRDSLRVAIDTIDRFPELARSTLVTLAENQGVTYDAAREEEPGRIPHELRNPKTDGIARMLTDRYGWQWPYFGANDTTPEFIRLLAKFCRKEHQPNFLTEAKFTGRDGVIHTMADSLTAAVGWIEHRLDANREMLIESVRSNPMGLENQMWRDSWDSFFHVDGKIANHVRGVSSVDVQRVAYDALIDAADLYENYVNEGDKAADLRSRADKLKTSLLDIFWTDDKGGFFVLGTDRDESGQIRPLKIRTSDMGHLLHSRLLTGTDEETIARREAIITHLFSAEMLGLNGIRTLASDEVRYRPGAYHNGSVWLWDNYLIIQGLALHGYNRLADNLAAKIINDVGVTKRFPEYLRGDDQTERLNHRKIVVFDNNYQRENVVEQPPQDIQAWTVAAVLGITTHYKQERDNHGAADPRVRRFEDSILSRL